jgi:hypothetical protein
VDQKLKQTKFVILVEKDEIRQEAALSGFCE